MFAAIVGSFFFLRFLQSLYVVCGDDPEPHTGGLQEPNESSSSDEIARGAPGGVAPRRRCIS